MFKKNFIYLVNHSEEKAKYCVPVNTGNYYICDCILLDKNFRQLQGFEYPIPIKKEQLGVIISHVTELS